VNGKTNFKGIAKQAAPSSPPKSFKRNFFEDLGNSIPAIQPLDTSWAVALPNTGKKSLPSNQPNSGTVVVPNSGKKPRPSNKLNGGTVAVPSSVKKPSSSNQLNGGTVAVHSSVKKPYSSNQLNGGSVAVSRSVKNLPRQINSLKVLGLSLALARSDHHPINRTVVPFLCRTPPRTLVNRTVEALSCPALLAKRLAQPIQQAKEPSQDPALDNRDMERCISLLTHWLNSEPYPFPALV